MLQHSNRIFGLDLLRAFAIMFVVVMHGSILLSGYVYGYRINYLLLDGVTLFFVLSGFLIGRILLKTMEKETFGTRALVEFWVRRWMRTLPLYFLVLVFLIVAWKIQGKPFKTDIVPYFFFAQNIVTPHANFFGEAWSLTVEEWFYLSIPLLIFAATHFTKIDRKKIIVSAIISVIIVVTLGRIFHAGTIDIQHWDGGMRKLVVTRLDSMMFGVAGAYLSLYKCSQWTRNAKFFLMIGVALLLIDKALSTNITYLNYLCLSVEPIAALMLLPFLSNWKRKQDICSKFITHISINAYALYLLHLGVIIQIVFPVYKKYCSDCTKEPILDFGLYLVVTFIVSHLLCKYFELPLTNLRERFAPTQGRGTEPREIFSA